MEHITTLSLHLKSASEGGRPRLRAEWLGPFLQGFLMEHTDSDYAALLHASTANPYSQYCCSPDGAELVWKVCALTDEAASYLVDPIARIDEVKLHAVNETFLVQKAEIETLGVDKIIGLLSEECPPKHRIRFVTPTSFKSRGEYMIMPSTRLIFQSLFMRYSQVYAGDNEVDGDTIDYISSHSRISSYNLHSMYYPISADKKTKIPAFAGETALSISGKQPLQGLANMLLTFGEYAGIGIKTSMGMGGVRMITESREGNVERRHFGR